MEFKAPPYFSPTGGIGRRCRLKICCPLDVRVRVPSWALKNEEIGESLSLFIFLTSD